MRMLGGVQAQFMMAWRVSRMYESCAITEGQAALAKLWNTRMAREVAALGRELLGGNGIGEPIGKAWRHLLVCLFSYTSPVVDFHVAKAFADLEALYTYEGTYDINTLVVGREVTGFNAIRPAR